jgi:hypothetical protein
MTTTQHESRLAKTAPIVLVKQQGVDWIQKELEIVTDKISRKGGGCKILERWQHKLIIALLQIEQGITI